MGDLDEEDTSSMHHELTDDCQTDLDEAGKEAVLEAVSRMINNRNYSDLVIVCKNGVRKYGSRLWLSARCAELERLVMNGTITESGLAVISLPNTSPAAMLIVLEYLHTGSPGALLQRLEPRTIRKIGSDVINAARQLHLPRLENYLWMMLEADILTLDDLAGDTNQDTEKKMILEALSRMWKIPRYSDVVIESKDGVLVPASRLWLDARCPVLGRMFTSREVSIGHVYRTREKVSLNLSTEVVHIVLDYLYTGSARTYLQRLEERRRWRTGIEAISASRYLGIPQLEKLLWSLLLLEVSRSTTTSETAPIELSVFRLSQLLNFPFDLLSGSSISLEAHARQVDFLARKLVRIIDLAWMDTDYCIKHLNRDDFTFFLMKSRRRSYDTTEGGVVSYELEEYLRVRSIVKWCVWEQSRTIYMSPEVAMKLVSIFFTKAEFTEALHFHDCTEAEREESFRLLYRERQRIARAKTTRRILKQVCNIAKFQECFLPFVNLERIHPALLTNLLKPWGLISRSLIQQAIRNQAHKARHLSYYVHSENRLITVNPDW